MKTRMKVRSTSDARRKYVVIKLNGTFISCGCKGWIFNRTCRHLDGLNAGTMKAVAA